MHRIARQLIELLRDVRLIPTQYVKPFLNEQWLSFTAQQDEQTPIAEAPALVG